MDRDIVLARVARVNRYWRGRALKVVFIQLSRGRINDEHAVAALGKPFARASTTQGYVVSVDNDAQPSRATINAEDASGNLNDLIIRAGSIAAEI